MLGFDNLAVALYTQYLLSRQTMLFIHNYTHEKMQKSTNRGKM